MDGSMPGVSQGSLVSAPPARPRVTRKRVVLGVLLLAVLAGGAWYGWDWWTNGRFLESTDDAYLAADMAPVSSRIAGQITEVLVADNQVVRKGDVVARLDEGDLKAALDQARADVASAQADIASLQAQVRLQDSIIAGDEADEAAAAAALTLARADYARYTDLAKTGAGSVQRAQQAESDIRSRDAALTKARAVTEAARQQRPVLAAQLLRAQAVLAHNQAAAAQAALNLSYATITAPVDGAVGDRTLRVGQYVQPGTKLLSVVPMGAGLYVVANFKETQLARMGSGESVTVELDMLPGHAFKARVDSLAPGSGSTFALLPPENATGNFTKIVQRVPVRLRLEPDEALEQLRPGLSVTATVDTRTAPPGRLRTLAGS